MPLSPALWAVVSGSGCPAAVDNEPACFGVLSTSVTDLTHAF